MLKVPKVNGIIEEAFKKVLAKYGKRSFKELIETQSFSKVINEIEEEANNLYKYYEKEAIRNYIRAKGLEGREATEALLKAIDNSLVTSIANIRRARAGLTSEKILINALRELGIPCQRSNIKRGGYKPDISIPNDQCINVDANMGFVLAVKRTLRERWGEDVPIFNNFPNSAFILIKPDPDFTIERAKDMVERGMKLIYIPDELYEKYKVELKSMFKDYFKKLSELPKDLENFLKQKGYIK